MLRWIFLASGVGAFLMMLAVGYQLGAYLSFVAMFTNFATFCLQYDGPMNRARARMAGHLAGVKQYSDAHQRLESAKVRTTQEERKHPVNMMTALNFASGIACIATLIWGIVLWAM